MPGKSTLPAYGGPPRTQCVRFIKSKDRRCEGKAEPGATTCRFHGARAGQVKKKAEDRTQEYRDRIMELADKAIKNIEAKIDSPNHAVSLRASIEVLDRNNISGVKKSESSVTITRKSELDSQIEELMRTGTGGTPGPAPDMLGVPALSGDEEDDRPTD